MFPKPKPVWISPAVIGQAPRPRKFPKIMDDDYFEEPQPPSPGEIPSDIAQSPQDTETGDEDIMGEPMSLESEIRELKFQGSQIKEFEDWDAQLMASAVPLPESDSDEVDVPESPKITMEEVIVPLDNELAEDLLTPKGWSSPSYSEEGIAARVWVSPQIAEWERWMVVKANLKTMELIPRSPYVPRTFSEWLTHRADMTDMKVRTSPRGLEWLLSFVWV